VLQDVTPAEPFPLLVWVEGAVRVGEWRRWRRG